MSEIPKGPRLSYKLVCIFVGVAFTYIALCYWLDSYRIPRWYQEFHRAQLRGIIYRVGAGKSGVNLKLNNGATTYHFFPINLTGQDTVEDFRQLAAPGDSIYKVTGSDTMYVIIKGRKHAFINEDIR